MHSEIRRFHFGATILTQEIQLPKILNGKLENERDRTPRQKRVSPERDGCLGWICILFVFWIVFAYANFGRTYNEFALRPESHI
jgi:hypothetical protein